MAMGPNAFWEAMQNGGVAQPAPVTPTPQAARKMAKQNSSRNRRLLAESAKVESAARKVQLVNSTPLEDAQKYSAISRSIDSARSQTPNPVVEPVNSLPGERSRAGAYEAYGKYLEHLRRASAWNGAVHAYRLPLPTVDLNPVGDDFRQITHDPYYATRPHEALRYNTPDDSNYSKHFDTTYMGDAPILSKNPVYTDKDLYGRPIPVRIGAQNPFEVNPSPYTFSEFAKAMRSRMGGQ